MKYQNPVIKGFHPDPSVCRVGKDYYLVTSTFEYFPCIPVYHSTDLVNWELIGHCIDRPEQLPMDAANASGGVWAPTIRYHEGTFYVTATFSEKGNFIVSSKTPGGGYSDPVWTEMDGIDPSMYFEDGEMYYCANDFGSRYQGRDSISAARMDPDTGRLKGEITCIWNGTGNGWLEAPHIYHIDGYYYLFVAEGGSGWGHMVNVARSRSIWGPYEACPANPILTNRNDASKRVLETGHADLIDDGEGNYYIVHLGIRSVCGSKSNLGRETFLMPVTREDGWFLVEGGKALPEAETRFEGTQKSPVTFAADFTESRWEKEWVFIGAPCEKNYARGNGELVLHPSGKTLVEGRMGVTFAAVRQPDFECEAHAVLQCDGSDIACGLAAYVVPGFLYRIYKSCEADGSYVVVEKFAEDFHQIAYREKVPQGEVEFIIRADRSHYHFSYRINGSTVNAADASIRFLCTGVANRCFTGTVVGVFAEGNEEERAVVKRFEVSERASDQQA
ncbi:MAG: family 43 glycosylhydrolase [Lachnospiraceae bacterium]|nr:family 43 glycosylhydrolase [Lachnospiraceae bacterium]